MTKAELLVMLADVPDETLIVMSEDAEGNDFSPLSSVEATDAETGLPLRYRMRPGWGGEINCTDDGQSVRCVVLWPED